MKTANSYVRITLCFVAMLLGVAGFVGEGVATENNASLTPLTPTAAEQSSPALTAVAGFTYDTNTFVIYNDCLGVYPGTSLLPQEEIWSFAPPTQGRVTRVIPAKTALEKLEKVGFGTAAKDPDLAAELNCAFQFRADLPLSLAQVSHGSEGIGVGLAIRNLPAKAWIAQGGEKSIPMALTDNPYVATVRHLTTPACLAPDSLVRMRKFPVREKREIIQLDIGKLKYLSPEARKQKIAAELQSAENSYQKWAWPEYKQKELAELEKKDYVESAEICRFYLDGSHILGVKNFTRQFGDESNGYVDEFDSKSWTDTFDEAIGFISLNEGQDWDVLRVDVGFDEIYYSIERSDGSIKHFSKSLRIVH